MPVDEEDDDGPDPLAALFGAARGRSKPKKSRAEEILDMLERARSEAEFALDAQTALRRVSENARNYGAALFEFGAIDDERAAKELGVSVEVVSGAAEELAKAMKAIFE